MQGSTNKVRLYPRSYQSVLGSLDVPCIIKVHPSGYYAWLKKPISTREQEDQRLLVLIKEHYLASGSTHGNRWIHKDWRDAGEICSVHRVAKIMRKHRIKAQIGYKRRYIKRSKTAKVAANLLSRNFNPEAPNISWVGDITYVRIYEGFFVCRNGHHLQV